MKRITLLFLIACMCCGGGYAQTVPDFQNILNNLQTKLNAVSYGKWSATAYSFVKMPGAVPPFNQSSPDFPGKDHIQNTIPDDAHLALFQKVLEGDACTRELLGSAFVDAVRSQFFANQALVTTRETYFRFEVHDWTKIRANVAGINVNDSKFWIPATTIWTGQKNELSLRFDLLPSGISQKVDIPSLWGSKGLLNSDASPGLGDDIRDLFAAYLTMGQQGMVDYMQAVVFETFSKGVLPSITELILSLVKKKALIDGDMDAEIAWDPSGLFDKNDKAYGSTGVFPDIVIQEEYNPWLHISFGSDGWVEIKRLKASVKGDSVKTGILQYWLNWYTVGANGFGSGYANRFAHTSVLRTGGMTNQAAWQAANGNRSQFFVNAGVGINFGITQQPQPPSAPVAYGAQHAMTVLAAGGTGNPITYQWYAGPDASSMTAVPGAVQTSFSPVVDCYSWQGDIRRRYYRAVAKTAACGDFVSDSSNIVVVEGGTPPTISFSQQPLGGVFLPDKSHTLAVSASVAAGALQYQWQKQDPATSLWDDLPGKTSANLAFTPLRAPDSGTYRCKVSNQVGTNPVYWAFSTPATLTVAPAISFDPNPTGADLEIGQSHTLSVGASVAAGELEYRWYRNSGQGFQALGDWVNTGSISFSIQLELDNVTIAHSGVYRLAVRNTLDPFGAYTANSAAAVVNVSSGAIFYVDPTADNSDGMSWATAFHHIQDAIDAVALETNGGEVWIAGGPVNEPIFYDEARTASWDDGSGAVTGSLVMRTNVGVFGGFEGYRGGTGAQEARRNLRNRAQNWAVIDGSRARGGLAAWHVVVFGDKDGPTYNAVLDGVIISGGNASGSGQIQHTHAGGGIYNFGSAPAINNCLILNNIANRNGGGMANVAGGAAMLTNCVFANNTARRNAVLGMDSNRGGGAIFAEGAAFDLNFVTLVQNGVVTQTGSAAAGQGSGGLYYLNADEMGVNNTIVSGNTGGGSGQGTHKPQYTYSALQSVQTGDGNITANPSLYNADYRDLVGMLAYFVPQAGAAVVNSGDPLISGGDDFLGVLRPLENIVDMGAFELSTDAPVLSSFDTSIDIAQTTTIADPFALLDLDNSVFEAPMWKFSYEDKVFGCSDIPESTFTLTVQDILGRTGSTAAAVHVTESEDPVVVCSNMTVDLDSNGEYLLTAADILLLSAGSTDNCTLPENLTVTVSPVGFDCDDAGKDVNVTVTVTDEMGNDDYGVAVVTVNDKIAPVLPSPANTIELSLNASGYASLSLTDMQDLAAGATDNCAIDWIGIEVEKTEFDCSEIGTHNLLMTVYDVNGNSSTDTVAVVVKDIFAPELNGTRDRFFISAGADFTFAQALDGVTAEDICSGDLTSAVLVEVFDAANNPVAFPVPAAWNLQGADTYNFRMVYSVQDGSGNLTQEEVSLTLYALQLPVITINGANPVTHECATPYNDLKAGSATVYDPESDSDITAMLETLVNVDVNNPGSYAVVYSVRVPAFPSLAPVTAVRVVNVIDTKVPTLTLDGGSPLLVVPGSAYQEPGYSAWDSCAGALNNAVVVTGYLDVNTPGIYTLQYYVDDPSGQSAQASRTVVVSDPVTFTSQPGSFRLYTTAAPVDLEVVYQGGFNLTSMEWFIDNVGQGAQTPPPAGTAVKLPINPAVHPVGTYGYRLEIKDSDAFVYSTELAIVEVGKPLRKEFGPSNLELSEGDTARLRVGISGGLGGLHYSWYANYDNGKNFILVEDGAFDEGAYEGATTNTLRFAPYTEAMAGQYQVEVSDDFTSLTVGPVTVANASKLPAAGGAGLILLALITAAGGAAALRKRSH
jgi:hypothetical protein